MKKLGVIFVLVVLLAACSQQGVLKPEFSAQAGSWQKLGGALDFTVSKSAASPRLLLDRQGNLIAAWDEPETTSDYYPYRTYLERWNGTSWQSFGKIFPVSAGFIGFDATNNPLIIQTTSTFGLLQSVISSWDATSKTWKNLGNTFVGNNAVVNKNGVVYRVVQDKLINDIDFSSPPSVRGKNLIQRWNGSSWQTAYTFQKTIGVSSGRIDIPIRLGFKSDGITPVAYWTYPDQSSEQNISFWNGTSWVDTYRLGFAGPTNGILALDKKDQRLGFKTFGGTFSTYPFQGDKSLLADPNKPLENGDYITTDTANRPLISFTQVGSSTNDTNLVVQRWTGTVWVQLGGILDRVPTRFVGSSVILTDSKNTLYTAWLECVGTFSDQTGCSNYNIYVSKYVP
jgi:hypothetical protein